MKGPFHGTCSYVAACRFVTLGCFVGLGLTSQVHAGAATASITGFVKNPTKIGGNYIRQDHILITLEQQMARAETTYVSSALGKSLAGQAVLEIAPAVAGPAIARACFAAPVACVGLGVLGYMALSRLYLDDDEWQKEQDEFGPCYQTRHFTGGDPWFGCASSISSAVSTWVNTANAAGYMDDGTGASGYIDEYQFETVSVPGSLALNSTANATVKRTLTRTSLATGVSTETVNNIQVLVYHAPDNITTTRVPATEADMLQHANIYDPDEAALNDFKGALPVQDVLLQDSVATVGDAYSPDDTPNEGNWVQDRVRAAPNTQTPTDSTDLTTTTETVPVDNPNTPEVEGPVDGSDPDPDPQNPTPEDEPFDLCKEHPNIVACQDFGDVPGDEVPESEYDMAWNAEPLGLPASCPAPLALGSHGEYEFTAICDAAVAVSPLIVACGAICAAGIMLAAIRGS